MDHTTNKDYHHLVLKPNFTTRKEVYSRVINLQEIQGLTWRLMIQNVRRPSVFVSGVIQPLLWLLLFSALFHNAPIQLFTSTTRYSNFLGSGVIVFTAFTGALNSGLPIMFDREFGFFNRILSSPIYSKSSIVIASLASIFVSGYLQVTCIMYTNHLQGNIIRDLKSIIVILIILLLLSSIVTVVSLILAFILPGHIELLACILLLNLPILFSSTALAPLAFMPSWLQFIASINPLTYAIEGIRYTYSNTYSLQDTVFINVWGKVTLEHILSTLSITSIGTILISFFCISHKFED
uniref:ABC transmembrane type-2 domain-containing protein n=1 Tax=Yamadaella caenomyce TaxID=259029 RepID=A0A1G4NZB6_9FLOR|nr:Hypothetical protein ycf38 [Yamadaella caenomyce]SCW23866.1 Hypothetical protein ycf38 [Yamadaella caenomyce]